MIGEPSPAPVPGIAVVHARASPAAQKAGLDRQVARVTEWATGQGITVARVVTEVGSALSGKRRKFALVANPSEVVDDPMRNVTEILTSLCARLYGRHATANQAARAVEATTGDAP